MRYRHLGRTGVRVSPLCLGTLMLGAWGANDAAASTRIIDRALDSGINFVDTADSYSRGETERILGDALARPGRRDRVVLATKVHSPMGVDPNARGNSRRWIVTAVEDSLRRLRTDRIDVYQVHRSDPHTDIEETLDALTDLVRAGKVRYIGSSTFPAHRIVEAQWAAQQPGRSRFVLEQPPYSLLAREIEADVLPVCAQYDMGVAVWSPLAGGWLSGRYRAGAEPETSGRAARWAARYDMARPENRRKLDIVTRLAELADEAGLSLVHLALGFVLSHRAVTSAIIGPRTLEHLTGQLGAADLQLSADVLDRIDAIVPPGTTPNPADGGWRAPELDDPSLRRRA
ncbi:aldo/keto reductase [Pseudonocardia sp. HH130630-07]|uniref:aldo/keto reductase n=1 Tax=Pseudonocardia sp. HH130630-07 TaxID=1690815 RepID=UPI000814E614|nr:aldo/keto reductase [Pseudonocardia sp. HH130630-07]ANY07825.1 aldo/keto reductase [Pseudonocardia sp. HH130630-07]